ncbi:MAG: hypothetical protein DRQ78_10300, partial [Epsilonproteobacteria bacterium]
TYSYKTGVAPVDAVHRYKNQDLNDGTTILYDKRVSNAAATEARVHGNKNALKYRRNDLGQNRDEFGKGYTELYNMDILGLDGTVSGQKIKQLQTSTTDKMKELGMDMPTSRYDSKNYKTSREAIRKRRELYGANDPKANEMEATLNREVAFGKPGYLDRLSNSVDAFQAGTQRLVAGTGDMILDALTPGNNTLLDEAKNDEHINKKWGYDSRESDFVMQKSLQDWKDGDYVGAALGALTSPEVVAQSLPDMAAMFIPGGALTKMGRAAKAFKSAESTAGEALAAQKMMAIATKSQKAAKTLADNVGVLGVSGYMVNNQIDERTKNNDGIAPNMAEIALMYATNTALLATDKIAFGKIIKGENIDLVKKMIDGLDASGLHKVVKSVSKNALQMADAGGKEFAQEYMQQWGEILNEQLGTAKHGTDVWTAENFDNALMAGIAGMGAGSQMHSLGVGARKAIELGGKALAETEEEMATSRRKRRRATVNAAEASGKETTRKAQMDSLPKSEDGSLDVGKMTPEHGKIVMEMKADFDNNGINSEQDIQDAMSISKVYESEIVKNPAFQEVYDKMIADISTARNKISADSKITKQTLEAAQRETTPGKATETVLTTLGSSEASENLTDAQIDYLAKEGLGTETESSAQVKAAAKSRKQAKATAKTAETKTTPVGSGAGGKTIVDVYNQIMYGPKDSKFPGVVTQAERIASMLSFGQSSKAKKIISNIASLRDKQQAKLDKGTWTDKNGQERPHTKAFTEATEEVIAEMDNIIKTNEDAIAEYDADVLAYGSKTAKERQQGSERTDYQEHTVDKTAAEMNQRTKAEIETEAKELKADIATAEAKVTSMEKGTEGRPPTQAQIDGAKGLKKSIQGKNKRLTGLKKEYTDILRAEKSQSEPEVEPEVEETTEAEPEVVEEVKEPEATPEVNENETTSQENDTTTESTENVEQAEQKAFEMDGDPQIETTSGKDIKTDFTALERKEEIDKLANIIDSRKLNGKPSKAFVAQKQQARDIAELAFTAQENGEIESAETLINNIIDSSAQGAKTASTSMLYIRSDNDGETYVDRQTKNDNDKDMWIPQKGAENLQDGKKITKATLTALGNAVDYNISAETGLDKSDSKTLAEEEIKTIQEDDFSDLDNEVVEDQKEVTPETIGDPSKKDDATEEGVSEPSNDIYPEEMYTSEFDINENDTFQEYDPSMFDDIQ